MMSTWFIRSASPVGVVFDTGSFPGAMQSLLPTQMIWALALGCMSAYLTTKIPSMLGSNVYEGFQSAFMMAAVAAAAERLASSEAIFPDLLAPWLERFSKGNTLYRRQCTQEGGASAIL